VPPVSVAASAPVAAPASPLDDPDPEVRETAVEALGRRGDSAAVAPILAALARELREGERDAEPEFRFRAVRALEAIGSPGAVRGLVELLATQSSRTELQCAVLRALARLGDPSAVPAIRELEGRGTPTDWEVRLLAVQALARMREERSAAALVEALGSPDAGIRRGAAGGILALPRGAVVSGALLPRVGDPDPVVRRRAVAALAFHRAGGSDPAEARALAALFNDPDPDVAEEALLSAGPLLRSTPPGLRNGFEEPLARAAATGSRAVRIRALRLIGDMRDFPAVRKATMDPDPEIRAAASEILRIAEFSGYAPRPDRVAQLDDPDPKVRLEAVVAFSRNLDPFGRDGGRVEAVLSARLRDASPEVRQVAAEAAGRLRSPFPDGNRKMPAPPAWAVAMLLEALSDRDPGVRAKAARSLGELGDPRAVEPLRARFKDPDAGVGQAALRALARLDLSGTWELLLDALRKDVRPAVRREAAVMFGESRNWDRFHAEAVEALSDALSDPDREVRLQAGKALGNAHAMQTGPALLRALKGDPDRAVRRQAAFSLGNGGGKVPVADLRPLIDSPHWRDRKAAAWCLRGTQDPDGVTALIGLLGDDVRSVRMKALTVLENVPRDDRMIPPLVRILREDDGAFNTVAPRLWAFGPSALEPLRAVAKNDPDLLARYRAVSSFSGFKGAGPLVEALRSPDAPIRQVAAERLVFMKPDEAAEPLAALLADPVLDVRRSAVRALSALSTPRRFELLKPALDDEDDEIWKAASLALAKDGTGGEGTFPTPAPVCPHPPPPPPDSPIPWDDPASILRTRDGYARTDAVKRVADSRDPRASETLAAALADPAPDAREEAIRGLGLLRDRRAVRPLLENVRASRSSVPERILAVRSLGEIADPGAVRGLLALLETSQVSQDLTDEIVAALGRIGDTRAWAPLVALSRTPAWSARASGRRVLGDAMAALRDDRPVDELVRAIGSRDDAVRIRASRALLPAAATYPAAREALLSARDDARPEIRVLAVSALGDPPDREEFGLLVDGFHDEDPLVREEAAWRIAGWRQPVEDAAELLAEELTNPDPACRLEAIGAFGEMIAWTTGYGGALTPGGGEWGNGVRNGVSKDGQAAVTVVTPQPLGRLITVLIGALGDPSRDVRDAATDRIKRLGRFANLPLREAADRGMPAERERAARVLAHIDPGKSVDRLFRDLSDPDPGIRVQAARAFGTTAIPPPDSWKPLSALLSDADPEARGAAAIALGRHRGSTVDNAIRALLSDQAPPVRAAAIVALSRIPGSLKTVEIRRALSDPDPSVVLAALDAAEQALPPVVRNEGGWGGPNDPRTAAREIRIERLGVALLPLAGSPDPAVRRRVFAMLGKHRATDAPAALLAAARCRFPMDREAAALALAGTGDPAGVDALYRLAGDPSDKVREAAFRAVSLLGTRPADRRRTDAKPAVRERKKDSGARRRSRPVRAIAAGVAQSFALAADGTLWAWGRNDSGQLGDGTASDRQDPVRIGTDNGWRAVAAGAHHALAIREDGSLWAWGRNRNGELGDGTTVDRRSPVRVGSDNDWVEVSAGESHSAAVRRDGTLWCWGWGIYGQLGDNTTSDRALPARVGTDNGWRSVSAGFGFTVAIRQDGTLRAWGLNGSRELGDGTDRGTLLPIPVGADNVWKTVSAGQHGFLAIHDDGTLRNSGGGHAAEPFRNPRNSLGGPFQYPRSPSVGLAGTGTWKAVANGEYHSLAVADNGALFGWGRNDAGQAGGIRSGKEGFAYYVRERLAEVTRIGTEADWTAVAAGRTHSVGLRTDGSVWSWGKRYPGVEISERPRQVVVPQEGRRR
jgi:HEAT repeat protein/alpha-tubulin suppressor-like RCC1 family protein